MNKQLDQISQLDFCLLDVTLFLDTHPGNQEAMNYYREGLKHLQQAKELYNQQGDALTNREGNIQSYIEKPFPWVKGDNLCGAMKNVCNIL